MIPLFFSYVCDYCDNPRPDTHYRGYVVWRDDGVNHGRRHYVFPSRAVAERWRAIRGISDARIVEVLSQDPFNFRPSRGTVKGVELADRLFEIFPDHRFKPGPNRAFLAPDAS
jgi:hypothetical protein